MRRFNETRRLCEGQAVLGLDQSKNGSVKLRYFVELNGTYTHYFMNIHCWPFEIERNL